MLYLVYNYTLLLVKNVFLFMFHRKHVCRERDGIIKKKKKPTGLKHGQLWVEERLYKVENQTSRTIYSYRLISYLLGSDFS